MVTCFECDNDRSKIDDRSLNSPINRFRFGSRFSALVILLITVSICSRTFRIFDDNGSKSLDVNEFRNGLNDYQADLSDSEIKQLFQAFDTDGSGTLNFDEFLCNLRVSVYSLTLLDT